MDNIDGPDPGAHNFFRGGSLQTYADETRKALYILNDKIDSAQAEKLWNAGCW